MATIPSFIQEIHGILAYEPEALELDHAWDAPGPYTFSETWPTLPDNFYCELIEGHIVMSPRARYDHGYLSSLLHAILFDIADANDADAMSAPLDVVFSERVVLQPDLIYVENIRREQVIKGVMRGAPNLVIEIISPSNPSRDRKKKFKLYQKYGVPEYWLFDPYDQTQEFYVLVKGKYKPAQTNSQGSYRSPVLPVLKINTKELWKKYLKRFPNS
jgi:Uma2 family endonuclease